MFFANEETKIGMVVLHMKYLRIFFPSRFSTLKAQFYGLFWGAVRQLDLNSGVNKNKKRKKRPVLTFFTLPWRSVIPSFIPQLSKTMGRKKNCVKKIFSIRCVGKWATSVINRRPKMNRRQAYSSRFTAVICRLKCFFFLNQIECQPILIPSVLVPKYQDSRNKCRRMVTKKATSKRILRFLILKIHHFLVSPPAQGITG